MPTQFPDVLRKADTTSQITIREFHKLMMSFVIFEMSLKFGRVECRYAGCLSDLGLRLQGTYGTLGLDWCFIKWINLTRHFISEQPISEAVITVPPFFNQAERRAMLRAADLSGLKVLQLMNDNAAIALNYGVFRSKSFNKTATHYMFFDVGSSSTVATVVGKLLISFVFYLCLTLT